MNFENWTEVAYQQEIILLKKALEIALGGFFMPAADIETRTERVLERARKELEKEKKK